MHRQHRYQRRQRTHYHQQQKPTHRHHHHHRSVTPAQILRSTIINAPASTFSFFSQKSLFCVLKMAAKRQNNLIRKNDRQALLKAKYCPRAMPVQHFVNPGQLVHAVSCTLKTHKNPCNLDLWPMILIFNRLLKVVKVHVCAKFHQAKCIGSWVIVVTRE